MELECPFCKKKVKTEHEATMGCKECAEEWMSEDRVDHDTG